MSEELGTTFVDTVKAKTKETTDSKSSKPEKKKPEKFHYKEHAPRRYFSKLGIITILLLSTITIVALLLFLYSYNFKNKAFWGVTILGKDMGGRSAREIELSLSKAVAAYKIEVVDGQKTYEANLDEAGIDFNATETVEKLIGHGRTGSIVDDFLSQTQGFLSRYNVQLGSLNLSTEKKGIEPVFTIDQERFNTFLADLEKKINVAPKDSQIKVSGSKVQIIPAIFGKKLTTAGLRNQILLLARSLRQEPINVQAETLSPTIMDEKTREIAEKADGISSKSVILTYKDKKYFPNKETITSWIAFSRDNDNAPWKMSIEPARMSGYFKTIGAEINIPAVNKKVRVENGTKETVVQEGKNGIVINEAILGTQISDLLVSAPSVSLEIPMMEAVYKTIRENVVVANWDKYINVSIGTQTMSAYLKGGQKVGEWKITTGKNGWNTPTGTFLISSKAGGNAAGVCMPNYPSPYPLCSIHYVSYFTPQGHAIHEAWWRSSFGGQDYLWNGSHGCVNSPKDVAKFIFDWAPIGTPIIIGA